MGGVNTVNNNKSLRQRYNVTGVWAEQNPINREGLEDVLQAVKPNNGVLREVGLDTDQVQICSDFV